MIESKVNELSSSVFGTTNSDGLEYRLNHHLSETEGKEKEQRAQHESNSRKLNFIAVLLTALTVILGIMAFQRGNAVHSTNDGPKKMSQTQSDSAISSQQDSSIPYMNP